MNESESDGEVKRGRRVRGEVWSGMRMERVKAFFCWVSGRVGECEEKKKKRKKERQREGKGGSISTCSGCSVLYVCLSVCLLVSLS